LTINKYRTILHIADFGAPYPGNFFASLHSLEKELYKKKIQTIYILPRRAMSRDWVKELVDNKKIIFMSGNVLKDIFIIAKTLRKYNVDIIHTHFCWLKYNFIIKLANLLQNAKVVRHVHSMYIETGSDIYSRIKKWFFNADVLVPCSKDVGEGLVKSGFNETKIHLVKNCIDFNRLDKYEVIDNADFGVPKEGKSILMYGYNFYVKGVDIAIKAIDKLNSEYNENLYLLLPLASNEEVVKMKIKETLGYYPSWIKILPPRNDISTYIKKSDIFLSASRSEGFSYALVENAYNKKVIIYSDINVHCNLGLDSAIQFKTEDYLDLFYVLKVYLNNNKVITENELEHQKRFVINEYSLNNWIYNMQNVYKAVLD
jgi:hypothetical protein